MEKLKILLFSLAPKKMSLFAFKIITSVFWVFTYVCYLNMKEISVNVLVPNLVPRF